MTIAQAVPAMTRSGPRWLLLGSLALNLFFIGVAVAMAVRAPAPPPRWDPNVFVRVERIAATLPPADAAIVREAMQANHAAIDDAQTKYYDARHEIHETLRQDPFKIEDMRAAMAKMRAARQSFDQIIQGVFADAAPKMSSAGRHALADWRNSGSSKRSRQ
jgi:uncharacterized membrane protein